MTELQIEKARWIGKYDNLAEKINMPEYRWESENLETIKRRYASLYTHYMRTKHVDKPVAWIIKVKEEKEETNNNLKMGSIVKVLLGAYKNKIGQIIDLDVDFDQYDVKMANGKIRYLGLNDIKIV